MERLFIQGRAELGLRPETTLRAMAVLCDWLDRHVAARHSDLLARPVHSPGPPVLIDRTLDAVDNPYRDDVSLAMTLRGAGLTLDQVDRFVELFLAHLQAQALEGYSRTVSRLNQWLDRGMREGEPLALPN